MSSKPHIKFVKDSALKHLDRFAEEVRSKDSVSPWRCLYAALNPEITRDPASKTIAAAFLESSFDEADGVQVFWLDSGHLFIFFQGPVRAVIKNYEGFLDSISEGSSRPDYHFFWELKKFWGYFDQVLAAIVKEEEPPSLQALAGAVQEIEVDMVGMAPPSTDLMSQRQRRYKPLLLIVEDDRVTRHMLQASMEKYCDIAVAWTARQARQMYESLLPNLAFLDIELPDGDGQDLAELFCSHDSDSFVVMVSGHLSQDRKLRCMRAGAKGTVHKPVYEDNLLPFIDRYHKNRQEKRNQADFRSARS